MKRGKRLQKKNCLCTYRSGISFFIRLGRRDVRIGTKDRSGGSGHEREDCGEGCLFRKKIIGEHTYLYIYIVCMCIESTAVDR